MIPLKSGVAINGTADKFEIEKNAPVVDLLVEPVVHPFALRHGIFCQLLLYPHLGFDVAQIVCLEAFPFFGVVLGQSSECVTVAVDGGLAEEADEVFSFFQFLLLEPENRADAFQ